MAIQHLRDLRGEGLRWDPVDETLECTQPHALTRAGGFLKHVRGEHGERVLYRGQTRDWRPCLPSLFRGDEGPLPSRARGLRRDALAEYLEQMRGARAFVPTGRRTYAHAHEALLQHYGIKTPWVDLVDNVWVALWFATKRMASSTTATRWRFANSRERYAYILLVTTGKLPRAVAPGLWAGPECELIDLRVAAPSFYLRPHAQHGLLVRRRDDPAHIDRHILGTLKIPTRHARRWLGGGFLHDPTVMFPPPRHDLGYLRLLKKAVPPPDGLGEIVTLVSGRRSA
jgi:hypothetical protein